MSDHMTGNSLKEAWHGGQVDVNKRTAVQHSDCGFTFRLTGFKGFEWSILLYIHWWIQVMRHTFNSVHMYLYSISFQSSFPQNWFFNITI